MQRFKLLGTALALFILPVAASAQIANGDLGGVGSLMQSILEITQNIIIPFILFLGFVVFVWGMFKYFIVGATDEEARGNGKNLIIYSIVGFVMIFIFWGIINLVATSTGFEGQDFDSDLAPKFDSFNFGS